MGRREIKRARPNGVCQAGMAAAPECGQCQGAGGHVRTRPSLEVGRLITPAQRGTCSALISISSVISWYRSLAPLLSLSVSVDCSFYP